MLELPDGLCIDFAIMKTSSRVREVWFQLASKSQVVDVIDHCVDKHVSMNSSVFRSLEGIRAVENGADSEFIGQSWGRLEFVEFESKIQIFDQLENLNLP